MKARMLKTIWRFVDCVIYDTEDVGKAVFLVKWYVVEFFFVFGMDNPLSGIGRI
jgi:hypothetical protein